MVRSAAAHLAAARRRPRRSTRTRLEPRTARRARAGPAGRPTAELDLAPRPGRYVLFCNMAGHYLGGMHAELVGPMSMRRRAGASGRSRRAAGARSPRSWSRSRSFSALSVGALDPGDLALAAPGRGASRSPPASARSPSATSTRSCSSRAGAQADPATTAASCSRRARDVAARRRPRAGGQRRRRRDRRSRRDRRRPCARSSSRSAGSSTTSPRPGARILAGRPVDRRALTAHERLHAADPSQRLRVLAALTSNVSLERRAHDRRQRGPQHQRPDHRSRSCSASPGFSISLAPGAGR